MVLKVSVRLSVTTLLVDSLRSRDDELLSVVSGFGVRSVVGAGLDPPVGVGRGCVEAAMGPVEFGCCASPRVDGEGSATGSLGSGVEYWGFFERHPSAKNKL